MEGWKITINHIKYGTSHQSCAGRACDQNKGILIELPYVLKTQEGNVYICVCFKKDLKINILKVKNVYENKVGQSHETHCILGATGQEKGMVGCWDVNTVRKKNELKVP